MSRPISSSICAQRPAGVIRDITSKSGTASASLVQYQVTRLSELDGQRMLDEGPSGLLPFAPLMQRPAGLDAKAWLRRCVQATEAVVLADAVKVDLLGAWLS